MSLHSYHVSRGLSAYDPPFSALIFAAMRKADTGNQLKLMMAFPELWTELALRYDAPGGAIDGEHIDERFIDACMAEVGHRR